MSRRQLDGLIKRGIAVRSWDSVYALAGVENSWHRRAMAAVLSVPGSALSFRSAARLHGLTFVASERIHITTPDTVSAIREGIKVHRSQQLAPFIVQVGPLQTTNVARTLVDLSAVLTVKQLGAVVDQACNMNLVKLEEISHCLDAMVTVGRSRVSNVREVLATRTVADQDLDSFLERRTLKWMRAAGLPEPVTQKRVTANGTTYRPDIQYRELKLAIEPDGPHHLLPSIAAYDRMRDADLGLEGWLVFHVYLETTPDELIPRIRIALNRRKRPK